MTSFWPAYLDSYKRGELSRRVKIGRTLLKECTLCPHKCGVNRLLGQKGICQTAAKAVVCSYHPHSGEERPISGRNGSGTVFFTYCNLLCNFCQNYMISHEGEGREVSGRELAHMMMTLQGEGCHNINFVTPSHVIPQILEALEIAVPLGLKVPLVFNSAGYDAVESLRLLQGIFDIYMPDFKFWDTSFASKTTRAKDYPNAAREALKEMHRQVGDLKIGSEGIAERGLLLRHLVMPGGVSGTKAIMHFIATEISKDTYVNIMDQYFPAGDARGMPLLSRRISGAEYTEALRFAEEEGLWRFDK